MIRRGPGFTDLGRWVRTGMLTCVVGLNPTEELDHDGLCDPRAGKVSPRRVPIARKATARKTQAQASRDQSASAIAHLRVKLLRDRFYPPLP